MYSNNIPRLLHLLLALAATLCFMQSPAHAQQDQGRIGGVITDSQGAIVPGASVVVKNEKTGEERTATSTESGSYIVSGLRPSLYTVTATAQSLTVRASSVQVPDNLKPADAPKVKEARPSKLSAMPEGLLNVLHEDEVLDLLAYLLSGGDRSNAMFAK